MSDVDSAEGSQLTAGPAGDAGSTPPAPEEAPQGLGLMDMPAPWLDQLVQEVATEHTRREPTLMPLVQACCALRDRVFVQRPCVIAFRLPIPTGDEAAAAQTRLLLACQRSPHVKLSLWYDDGDDEAPAQVIRNTANLMQSSMVAAVGAGLTAIRDVELDGLNLNTLVPSWLSSTLPHMTSLTLNSLVLQGLPPPTTPLPTCSQLKALTLRGFRAPHDGGIRAKWVHQIGSLVGLNSLSLSDRNDPATHLALLQCFTAIGSQLTHLKVAFTGVARQPLTSSSGEVPIAPFPYLQDLDLHGASIEDGDMEALLSLQHLTALRVGQFRLHDDYRARPCRWTRLTFERLRVDSFDRLPLGAVQSLEVAGLDLILAPAFDELGAANGRVAAVFARAGGVRWARTPGPTEDPYNTVWLEKRNDDDDAQDSMSALAAVFALVALCKPCLLRVDGVIAVTCDLLHALKQHLSSVSVKHITFQGCTFAPGALPLLLPSLPPATTALNLLRVREAEATEMCVHACRPIKVTAAYGWERGWQKRVQAAMAAAGHQHVDLSDLTDE